MKKLILFLLIMPSIALADGHGFSGLTGGAGAALDGIAVATISDNDQAWGLDGTTLRWYEYDAASSAAESSPDVIQPDDNAGNGRWLLVSTPIVSGGTAGGDLSGTYPNPTVNDGADSTAIHNNVSGEINAIAEKATPVNADVVIIEDSAASYAKKKVQIGNLPSGGGSGDITRVLDVLTGDVLLLRQDAVSFSAADATPSVANGSVWETVDTTTITDFDDGSAGQLLWVYCGAATVFDFTASSLVAANRTTDYTASVGDVLLFLRDGTSWYAANAPDETATVTVNGYLVRDGAGSAVSRDFQDTTTITWTNSDGVSGNSSAVVADGSLTEPKLNATNSPADGQIQSYNSGGTNFTWVNFPVDYGVAASDETTDLTTGTAKITFRVPRAFTLTEVRANVNTAPVGSTIIVDINEGGTSVLSTKITIDASEKTSETAATPPVISDSAIADDAEITIDIDQIGSSTAGKGLKVWLIGYITL